AGLRVRRVVPATAAGAVPPGVRPGRPRRGVVDERPQGLVDWPVAVHQDGVLQVGQFSLVNRTAALQAPRQPPFLLLVHAQPPFVGVPARRPGAEPVSTVLTVAHASLAKRGRTAAGIMK